MYECLCDCNIDCNIFISSMTRISPLEDQNFPQGEISPRLGTTAVDQCRGERLSVGSNCLVHKTGCHIPTSRYNNIGLNFKASQEIPSKSIENCRFRQPHCGLKLTSPFQGTPAKCPHKPYIARN